MDLIRAQPGLRSKIAKGLGITRPAVLKWTHVPAERLVEAERIPGIPREFLRPELYRKTCACAEAA